MGKRTGNARKFLLGSTSTLAITTALVCGTAALVTAPAQAQISIVNAVPSLSNTGTVSGVSTAISIAASGSLGTLSNSGLISGTLYALYNAGSLGTITNSGTIAGNIYSASAFTISGGSGTTVGTLTGYNGSIGTISRALLFDTGALALNDVVASGVTVVGTGGTLTNTGTIGSSTVGYALDVVSTASISTLTNSGTILSVPASAIHNSGSIDKIVNNGEISGGFSGLNNTLASSSIGMFVNEAGATISTVSYDVYNNGHIGTLSNRGVITSPYLAINNRATGTIVTLENSGLVTSNRDISNSGNIGLISNSGTITASGPIGIAIANAPASTITAINNSGLISGTKYAVNNGGSIGTITNSGVIFGNIKSSSVLTFAGGATTAGTLTGGTITANVAFAAGTLALAENIVGNATLTGGTLAVASGVSITGNYNQSNGILEVSSSGLMVSGAVSITGGTIVADILSSDANYLMGGGGFTLINGDNSSSYTSASVQLGGFAGLSGNTTVVNGDLIATYGNDYVGGTLGSFTNSGSIGGGDYGFYVSGGGSIGSLTNSGSLGGTLYAFYNGGTIGTFVNDGTISDGTGYANAGLITSLTNNGTISGGNGLVNSGTIQTLTNVGSIDGTTAAGLRNSGTISALTNTGTISGVNYALYNTGVLGPISNSGQISGNIYSTSVLTINGGTGSAGTLTGGAINANIVFASGTLALADDIVGNAILTGARLNVVNGVDITGSYRQSAGVLDLSASGILTVTGTASIIGGTILAAGLSSTSNYLAGSAGATLIDAGAGSSYAGASVSFAGLTGLSAIADATSTEDLKVIYRNDYIGANLANLSNTGSISSSYGVYIAATGVVGTLANSGTISGSQYAIYAIGSLGTISNTGLISGNIQSGGALSISGSGGTLSGGTITAPAVTFASGTQVLADNIVGNASNAGATLNLGATLSITGNYAQTSGVLDLAGRALLVSGTASFTGGTIAAALQTTGNYLAGSMTVLQASSGLSNTGATVTLTNISGLSASLGASDPNALAIAFQNDYVGGSLADLTNSGSIGAVYGVYVASTGALGTLSNTGTISGTDYAIYGAGALGTIANNGLISGNIASTSALTFAGGTGTLSGGTITAPTINFTSGTVALADDVVGNASNAGARLNLASGVSITGNYSQSDGILDLSSSGTLTIMGVAHLAGGTVMAGALSTTGNYLSGDSSETLIDASAGSSYTGVTVAFAGLDGLSASADTTGTEDLKAVYRNDYVGGALALLTNSGTIGGSAYGAYIASNGSVGTFVNTGSLGGSTDALYNAGVIVLLQNDGAIADGSGIHNTGSIAQLTNSGLIEGDSGINNTGTIGGVLNSGTITGPVYAIDNSGSLGLITNSGTIAGNIRSTNPLAIAGGTGTTYGVLNGGIITADVNFTAGNQRLSDAVVGQVSNSGAQLQLGSQLTITGAYSQTAGTLDLGSNVLTVSGKASISGGTVSAVLPSAANYLIGQSITLIDAAAGSSYAGATVSLTPITGLVAAASTANTEDFAVTFGNDYIGGSLASLNNTGTLSGAAYGVYVASGGNLGALANSGTIRGTQYALYSAGSLGTVTNTGLINGNIRSTGQLVLAGTGGTLSGGTITATGVSIAGSLRLADAINVGSGTVSAGTASVELPSKISITGNYLQTGGVLISDVTDTTTYGALAVSGSATITNTTITVNGSTFRAGQTYTIVDAGAASNYNGDTIRLAGTGHFRLKLSTVGDDLLALVRPMFGEIGTAKGGAAAVVGGVLDRIADNNGLPAMVDRLSALPDADLGRALEQAAPAEVGGGVASLQRMSLIEDLIGTAVSSHRSAAPGWSVWQEALGGTAQRNSTSGATGYDTTAVGLVLGVDNRIRENLLVGAALDWSAGWNAGLGDVSGHASGMNGFALTGYGSWTRGALTVNGRVAAGLDHYKQHRTLTSLNEKAEAEYSGQHYVIAADGSYDFTLAPGVTLSPQASLRWLRLTADSYSEAGIGALTVNSVIADQVQSNLGAKLAWIIDTRFGVVAPEIRAAWLHDFLDDAGETNAVLGGLSFTTTSARIAANGIRVGTGLTFCQSDATSLRLEYDGEFRDDYTAHGGMLQLSLKL